LPFYIFLITQEKVCKRKSKNSFSVSGQVFKKNSYFYKWEKTIEILRGEAKNTGIVIVRDGIFLSVLDIAREIIHIHLEDLKNTIQPSGSGEIARLTRERVFEILDGNGEQITDNEIREVLVCKHILEP
jgi:hypothetical protein